MQFSNYETNTYLLVRVKTKKRGQEYSGLIEIHAQKMHIRAEQNDTTNFCTKLPKFGLFTEQLKSSLQLILRSLIITS